MKTRCHFPFHIGKIAIPFEGVHRIAAAKVILLAASFVFFHSSIHAQEVPVFQWAKQTVKGPGGDDGNAVTTDAGGNVLSTGLFTQAADFDPGPGVFTLTSFNINSDIFISKIDGNGNFLWAKSIGGAGSEGGYSIVADAAGNVYVTGLFSGGAPVDFDPGPGTFNLTSNGDDMFVLKLDSDGDFVWAKGFDTPAFGRSVAVDASGFVYVTGNSQFGSRTYVLKLDQNGNVIWSKNTGGTGFNVGNSLSVAPGGDIVTIGYFSGTVDFDPGTGLYNLTSLGADDIFILRLDNNGNFVWASRFGGTNYDRGKGIDIS